MRERESELPSRRSLSARKQSKHRQATEAGWLALEYFPRKLQHWQQRRPLSTKQAWCQPATSGLSADAAPPRVSSIKFEFALCGVARAEVHCSMGNKRTSLFASVFNAL